MKRGEKTFICTLCALALTLGARAVVNDSETTPATDNGGTPYSAIWVRNVFNLKAPAPPVEAVKANTPPPNVILTGITTLLGSKRALFLVQDPQIPGKPPNKEESYILTEGQRQGVLEVLEINPKAGTVKIKNEDIVSTITFATNKVAGGGPGPGGGPSPMAAGIPQPYPPSSTPMPTRMMRGGAAPSQPIPQNGYGQPASPSGYPSGYGQGGSGATAGLALPNAATQNSQPLTPDEQAAAMLIQHQLHAADIAAGTFPPLPMTPAMQQLLSPTPTPSPSPTQGASSLVPTAPNRFSRTTGNFH